MMEFPPQMKTNKEPLIVAYVNPWKSLHPGLQHTIVADLILSNKFDSLIGSNEEGLPVPLAAKEWNISSDYKTATFKIDTAKQFPNGSPLSSGDFKRSWEEALKLDPKSNNSSLLDVLYKISGFEDFKTAGTISGIETPDKETLVLNFKSPFRMLLDQLQGNRFSCYQQSDQEFLGTGNYEIKEIAENELLFFPSGSDYHSPDFRVLFLTSKSALDSIKDGKVDIVAHAFGNTLPEDIGEFSQISMLIGQDAIHMAFQLNSLPGHSFSDEKMRRGLQYLIHNYLKRFPELIGDPQIFLPAQAGRISDEEAHGLIEADKAYGQSLIEESRKRPLIVWSVNNTKVQEALKAIGLFLSEKSGLIPIEKYFEVSNKSSEFDILISVFSVSNGDPDGIYHKLGKNGAIRGRAILSGDTSKELEIGREIINFGELHDHYQKVTRTFLREVPLIHLGFAKDVTLYRNDRVQVNSATPRKNQGHLHIFEKQQPQMG